MDTRVNSMYILQVCLYARKIETAIRVVFFFSSNLLNRKYEISI